MPAGTFRRRLTLSYIAPFLAMAALALLVLWLVQGQISVEAWVQHTNAVMLKAMDADRQVGAMELDATSYLLTGDETYREQLQTSNEQLSDILNRISALVSDNPLQERRLLELSGLRGKWMATAVQLNAIAHGRDASSSAFRELRSAGQEIRVVVGSMIDTEEELLVKRTARRHREDQLIFVLVPVMSILLAVVLSYEGWRQITRASGQYENALLRAEQASRSKDNFLATVSHELRNPLNTILLRSNLLLTNEPLSETGRRGVMTLERAAKAQAQLIEDLLDVSRIESGRLRLDLQAVDLVEVVKAAVEAMRVAADAKSITLQETVDPGVSPIAGDPQRLQQVVWNLISNAVKFTPPGGRIQVRLERIDSHIEIVVADSGKGIESSQLGYVFDRFWQAQDLAKGETGIGLGLSIVKHIVTLHGGTVIAQSDGLGKGSRFTVRLPLPISSAALDDRSRRHPTVAPPTNADDPGRLDGLSILVADDDETACQALQELLISLGAKVVTANSVDEALTKMGGFHSDVVICDIGMPVRDGISMAQEVRRRERDSGGQVRTPLIALTAYGRVDDKIRILNAGFDSHVVKPVELQELSAIIRNLAEARVDSRRARFDT